MYNIEHKIYRVTSKYYGLGAKSKAMNKCLSITYNTYVEDCGQSD